MQVTFNCSLELLATVDTAAQDRKISRSRFIVECLQTFLGPKEPSSTEVKLLTKDIDHLNEIITLREAEITELQEVNGRLWDEWRQANERLTQFLLVPAAPGPKHSFWSRFRRQNK